MENQQKAQQAETPEQKADNPSVQDEPTVQQKTPKEGKNRGETYSNKLNTQGGIEHDGVDKV
ncbi:MAG TPA: hypothetical protein VF646_12165 [Cytophagales bacterium]